MKHTTLIDLQHEQDEQVNQLREPLKLTIIMFVGIFTLILWAVIITLTWHFIKHPVHLIYAFILWAVINTLTWHFVKHPVHLIYALAVTLGLIGIYAIGKTVSNKLGLFD